MRHALKLSLLVASGLWLALPLGAAQAQGLGSKGIKPVVGQAPNKGPAAPPPSALPGATGPSGGVAPATTSPTDMQPNDALFDAINRGDILTARDAMARGADLGAHNILGMTPLELSIDLSRNDITFYLLSLRGTADAAAAPPKPVAGKPAVPTPARKTARAAPPRAVPAERPVAARATVPPAPQYAGGGTPDPAAGFLGFGGGTQIR